MIDHKHAYDIHYTDTEWQTPIFIKCEGCGSTYYLARKPVLLAAERLADATEDVLQTEYTASEWEEMLNAWQAYVDVASPETLDNIPD